MYRCRRVTCVCDKTCEFVVRQEEEAVKSGIKLGIRQRHRHERHVVLALDFSTKSRPAE